MQNQERDVNLREYLKHTSETVSNPKMKARNEDLMD